MWHTFAHVAHIRNYDVAVSNCELVPSRLLVGVREVLLCSNSPVQLTTIVVDQFITISVLELLNGERWCTTSVVISAYTATALILCRYN